ncbi:MAG: methionyl-tRNA formyltransferase [Candidatus Endonucleobacter sp. (ex Gigantidas childressi)]|nr:methionyl-tRNA formyltransferase [Candidatus Endonucleobacter sp. (ex Gigantidas childressi)]
MKKQLRIIFAGTPDFASAHMQAILDSNHRLIAVYSQPDRPAGRGRKLKASSVKTLALQHNIPVYQPISLREEDKQEVLAALNPDLMVVVAYGLILPQVILDTPQFGCVNVHGSILPRWRGAAPIQRAIAASDKESGVTIMQMDAGLDTGDILIKAYCPIYTNDTSADLHDRLIEVGKPALIAALDAIAEGRIQAKKQDNKLACYAHKLSKAEARLDWQKTAAELEREVLAFNPWPVATIAIEDLVIKVWQATAAEYNSNAAPGTLIKADKDGLDIACSDGVLRITQVQPPSARAMPVQDLLNSRKTFFIVGNQFHQPKPSI